MSTNQIKSADGALDVRGTLDRVQRHRRTLQPSASHRNPSSSSSSSASASARPSSPTPANIRRSSKRSVRTILWEACQRMVVVLAAVVVLWGAVKLVVQPLSSAIFGSARQQQDTVAVMDDTDNELGGAAAGSRAAAQQPTSAFGRAMHGLTAFFRGDRDVMEVGADATTQTDSLERLSIGKEGEAAERAAASDARQQLLGHYRTAEAPLSDLVVLKEGRGKIVKLRSTAARHFSMMATAAKADGVDIIPLSGFRSIQDQVRVFFDLKARRVQQASERAKVSAPPGYSEHHTGYALDVGDARYPNTHLEISFETTPAYKWLQKNAARFHFELSFPPNNPQGIMYEPWHWRFVGDVHSLETFAPSKMT